MATINSKETGSRVFGEDLQTNGFEGRVFCGVFVGHGAVGVKVLCWILHIQATARLLRD